MAAIRALDGPISGEDGASRPGEPALPDGAHSSFLARLGPERKTAIAAGLAGYLLCLWQALCVVWPLPHLGGAPETPETAQLRQYVVNSPTFSRRPSASFDPAPPRKSQVRKTIRSHIVRHTIDPSSIHPEDPEAWARVAQAGMWGKSKAVFRPSPVYTMASLVPQPRNGRPSYLAPPGALAARFESGPEGVASVGHTPRAGTSYGIFQIASGTPTYNNFLRFLEARAPDWQARLQGKGPANTGSISGAVPEEWRRIAQENPKRFEQLQYEFILSTHYRPAVADIYEETGVDVSSLSPATREVLWSVVVQHGAGGGSGIFISSINALKNRVVDERRLNLFEQALIEEVYAYRLKVFGGNPSLGRSAMVNRYGKEKNQALSLLDRHYSGI